MGLEQSPGLAAVTHDRSDSFHFVRTTPTGSRVGDGVSIAGEIGVVGVSAAIANAVSHATGRRIRSCRSPLDETGLVRVRGT
jgi:CO/xanthine dehydrogenase Mo-binding subunit